MAFVADMNQKLNQQLMINNQQILNLLAKNGALEQIVQKMTQDYQNLQQNYDSLRISHDQLTQQNEVFFLQISLLNTEINNKDQEINALNDLITEARGLTPFLNQVMQKLHAKETECRQKEKLVQSLEQAIQRLRQKQKQQQQKNRKRIQAQKDERTHLLKQFEILKMQREQLQCILEGIEKRLQQTVQSRAALLTQNKLIQAKLDELKAHLSSLLEYNANLQENLWKTGVALHQIIVAKQNIQKKYHFSAYLQQKSRLQKVTVCDQKNRLTVLKRKPLQFSMMRSQSISQCGVHFSIPDFTNSLYPRRSLLAHRNCSNKSSICEIETRSQDRRKQEQHSLVRKQINDDIDGLNVHVHRSRSRSKNSSSSRFDEKRNSRIQVQLTIIHTQALPVDFSEEVSLLPQLRKTQQSQKKLVKKVQDLQKILKKKH